MQKRPRTLRHLCDVNLLVALCYAEHEFHTKAKSWLDHRTAGSVVTCRITQLSLLRLLTTRAVMLADVCTREQAWSIWDRLMADFRLHFLSEPVDFTSTFRALSADPHISPKLWQDDYLAAFALSESIGLATFDQGFLRYAGLGLELLY